MSNYNKLFIIEPETNLPNEFPICHSGRPTVQTVCDQCSGHIRKARKPGSKGSLFISSDYAGHENIIYLINQIKDMAVENFYRITGIIYCFLNTVFKEFCVMLALK